MFIAVASHELKTPITIIKSCLNGLSGSKPNETDNDYILTAQRECDRMTDMVNNLTLPISRSLAEIILMRFTRKI